MAEKHSLSVWPIPQECIVGTGHLALSAPLNLATHGDAPWLPAATRQASEVLNRAAKGIVPVVVAGEDGTLERAIVLDKECPQSGSIQIERTVSKLIILHGTTMLNLYHRPTWGSFHRGPAELLICELAYADGKKESFSAYFGDDIGPLVGKWPTAALVDAGHRVERGGYCHQALPISAGEDHTFFSQEWTNTHPEVPITSIKLSSGSDAVEDGEVIVAAISILDE